MYGINYNINRALLEKLTYWRVEKKMAKLDSVEAFETQKLLSSMIKTYLSSFMNEYLIHFFFLILFLWFQVFPVTSSLFNKQFLFISHVWSHSSFLEIPNTVKHCWHVMHIELQNSVVVLNIVLQSFTLMLYAGVK